MQYLRWFVTCNRTTSLMKRCISICTTLLIIAGLLAPANSISQTSRVDFTWLNRLEQVLAGSVEARLIPLPKENTFAVEFEVTWFNEDGTPINEASSQPLLYLSQYALDLIPLGRWKCTSFADDASSEIAFSSLAKISIELLSQPVESLEIHCSFQYALSEDHYRKGALEKIQLPDGRTAIFSFSIDQKPRISHDSEAVREESGREHAPQFGLAAYKILMSQLANYQNQARDLQRRKDSERIAARIQELREESNPEILQAASEEVLGLTRLYLADLDYLISSFNSVRPTNLLDSLPSDSTRAITSRFNHLSDELLSLRSEYNQYDLMIRSFQPGVEEPDRAGIADSLRRSAKNTYLALFKQHQDSLIQISRQLDSLRSTIKPAVKKRAFRDREIARLEAQKESFDTLKGSFNQLKLQHQQSLIDYRSLVFGLGSIQEVEKIHTDYSTHQVVTENALLETDNLLTEYQKRLQDPVNPIPGWLIWTIVGLIVLLLVPIFFRLYRSSRNVAPPAAITHNMTATTTSHANGSSSLMEPLQNFYAADFVQVIPDVVIARMHISPTAITALYQLVHGAFLEKKPGSFGGYLFGNSYRLTVDGSSKHELVIEKVVASQHIRPDSSNTMEFRQDLVDEMNELIRQNKKYVLLGWFTSCSDPVLEMNEALQKMHRTFFDQKSQIAILVNTGSEELNSACFLRRKSGYFDPIPDPGAFLKWEKLYQFSQNPVIQTNDNQDNKPPQEFINLELNQGWCDTLVTRIRIEKSALKEIHHASATLASPAELYQVVGYLYGMTQVEEMEGLEDQGFVISIERFVEVSNETAPREIPGLKLLGWFGQGKSEIFSYTTSAINYHEQHFKEPFQVVFLLNSHTSELRILSRKQSLAMNDSSIDTEEFNFDSLLSQVQ